MPDVMELTERFGSLEIELDCQCVACGEHIEAVIVSADGIVCARCGGPVIG